MLLPTLFGQVEPLPDKLQEAITLSSAQGALGIPLIIGQSMSSSHHKPEVPSHNFFSFQLCGTLENPHTCRKE